MTSLLKKLSISIKIGVIRRHGVCLVSFYSKLSTESVGSHRELVANCVHTANADATKQFCRVGGVYCYQMGEYRTAERRCIYVARYIYTVILKYLLTIRLHLITIWNNQ